MSLIDEKYTILIVEDEPANISILDELLKNRYNLRVANNGEKAESMIASGKIPDLILLDIVMPGKNGYEVCESIKSMPGGAEIPIIFLSGKSETEEIVRGFKVGAVDYVTKPFQPEELLTRVETQLKLVESKKKLEEMYLTLLERNTEIEKGMETARLIQRKLLPSEKHEASWIKSSFCFIPMDKVGGDFYDYRADERFLEIFIADVSGHGLSGAIFSTIARVTKEKIGNYSSPSLILSELNDIMCRYTVEGHFITAFCCLIDREKKTISFSSAGHCPVLIKRQDKNEVFSLKTKGIPLGIVRGTDYDEEIMNIASGDRIIVYTDGITECSPPGRKYDEMWGDSAFDEFIHQNSSLEPDQFCVKLISDLTDYNGGGRFDDDLTLGVIDIL